MSITGKIEDGQVKDGRAVAGVAEWADSSVNIQIGCIHKCLYCFALNNSVRFKRRTPANWGETEIVKEKVDKAYHKRAGTIMFPTSHDIDPENLTSCIVVLKKMLAAGNRVLIVSKPHLECVKALCRELFVFKKKILFRFTIGSTDDDVLRFWEPGAKGFSERLASLRSAYEAGFETSVSCEPMLDLNIGNVIEKCRPFVSDAIWLGRANRLRGCIAINCPGNQAAKAATERLLSEQTDEYLKQLYERYKDDNKIRYKESVKVAAGLTRPTKRGLDI